MGKEAGIMVVVFGRNEIWVAETIDAKSKF